MGILLALLRAGHMAGMVLLFGSLLFRLVLGPCPRWLVWLGWAMALLGGAGWLAAEAVELTGATEPWALFAALGPVAGGSRFGRTLLLRGALLLPVPWLPGPWLPGPWRGGGRGLAGTLLAGAALALQPLLGHAGAADEIWLAGASTLHVLGIGTWFGSLPALLLALRAAASAPSGGRAARRLARRYFWLGLAGALAIAAGAGGQAWVLAGPPPAWIGTRYGLLLLGKLTLLLVLLAIAWRNQFRLTPLLGDAPGAGRALGRLVVVEIVLGAVALGLAIVLAGQVPGAHAQPDWPFAWRPSLAALAEPDLRGEIGMALLGIGAGFLAATIALAGFRRRFAAAMLALAGLASAWPSGSLLLVPARPTTFWLAPAPTVEEPVRGATLYVARCANCHGASGHGDGPLARGLAVPPSDLTAEHLWEHTDGDLYWWIAHGQTDLRGNPVMPAQDDLTEADIWALVAQVRALSPYGALYRRSFHRH